MTERQHVSVRLHRSAVEWISELAVEERRTFADMFRVLLAEGMAGRSSEHRRGKSVPQRSTAVVSLAPSVDPLEEIA